ncbi:tail fiber domain-containing protein [Phormidium tenue]|uniref:Peptidase S74 domain-containing protein n=1 Tax=Phormidium tenue NIES-30 TaxID=549789 RepID=A0A1U7IXV6_9CYAN|nr:tail fiber domain-containing protein [Phormidium tenue]MBD2233293.1 tail fiber domain-containing protein [Phormidium tenue FACHB-1052]OKH43275.1 hypothetical protein NIES30_25325 [Phormidium tenue NIES-30]
MAYDPTQRPRYFEGQYLEDTDFSDEQAYHRDRQQRHHRLLHISGIAEGLNWKEASAINQGKTSIADVRFSVSAGTAFDIEGRSIVLLSDSPVTQITVPPTPQGDWILFIQYREEATAPQGDKGTETRTSEMPRIELAKTTLSDFNQQVLNPNHERYAAIALAKFTVTNQNISTNLDFSVRQYAGLRLPTPGAVTALTLRSSNSGNLPLAILNGGLSMVGQDGVEADLTVNGCLKSDNENGGLWVTSNRFIGGHGANKVGFYAGGAWRLTVQSDGKTGIGTMTPSAALAINGGVHVGGDSDPGDNNLTVDGDTTLDGTLLVKGTSIFRESVTVNNSVSLTGITSALQVGGNAAIGGTLTAGNTSVGTLAATNTSVSTLATGNASVGGLLTVTGSSTFNGNLIVNNSIQMTGYGNTLWVYGSTILEGPLSTRSSATFNGPLLATGTSRLAGDLTVNSQVYLRGSASNTGGLVVNGQGNVSINSVAQNVGSFSFGACPLTLFEAVHNGGNTRRDTRDILHLVREGVSGESYANKASFALGRYLTGTSSDSQTQLDINLTDGSFNTHNTVMTLRSDGRVGIGTNTPNKGLVEIRGEVFYTIDKGANYHHQGGNPYRVRPELTQYSLYASDGIAASGFYAFSDVRIKDNIRPSNARTDLQTLLKLKVVDYSYKDKIAFNEKFAKKIIGQQVFDVYPQAVNKLADVVPDIFQIAFIKESWVSLSKHGLQVGERVKLLWEERESVICTVEAVTLDSFKVPVSHFGKIFVYGREVDDFHVVDYEALSMLHVSATQEMYKILTNLQAEVHQLKSKISTSQIRKVGSAHQPSRKNSHER